MIYLFISLIILCVIIICVIYRSAQRDKAEVRALFDRLDYVRKQKK